MYESTFVNTPSFWYGLKRPAESGRAKIRPPTKAAATSRTVRPRGAGCDIDSPRAASLAQPIRASGVGLRRSLLLSPKPEVRGLRPFQTSPAGDARPAQRI